MRGNPQANPGGVPQPSVFRRPVHVALGLRARARRARGVRSGGRGAGGLLHGRGARADVAGEEKGEIEAERGGTEARGA